MQRNFDLLHSATRALGSVPEMLSWADFSHHGLDEKAVVLYVAFLSSRLLEVSQEERAVHTIQKAWHRHLSR